MFLDRYYRKFRSLVQDSLEPDYYCDEYTNSRSFKLVDASVDETTIVVKKNQTIVASTNYTFDTYTSTLTFNNNYTLFAGDVIEIFYSAYKQYTNNQIRDYIESAVIRLSVLGYTTFAMREDNTIFPTPVEVDENLICFVAEVLADGNVSSYKTNEVSITFSKDTDNDEKIRQAVRIQKKTYGQISYINLRRPYTLYLPDGDSTYQEMP